MSTFCTVTYALTTSDSTVDACLNDIDEVTNLDFDIGCDETTIAGVLGT